MLLGIVLFGCVSTEKNDEPTDSNTSEIILTKAECINKVLYYKLETTSLEYDSISTEYFSEVKDYTDTVALKLQNEVWELEALRSSYLISDTAVNSQEKADSLTLVIEEHRQDLKFYQKSTVGYVFVHTFSIKSDTMSMIFLMDKACLHSDAIPIKTVSDIDPDDFRANIQDLDG